MKCFRKIHCKDTHSFYFRIIYRNLYSGPNWKYAQEAKDEVDNV